LLQVYDVGSLCDAILATRRNLAGAFAAAA
jgi:hypothetical protein